MTLEPFPCPACGSKGAFEITTEAQDLSAMDGAICGSCGHVVTEQEVKDWAFKFATQRGKEAFKKTR